MKKNGFVAILLLCALAMAGFSGASWAADKKFVIRHTTWWPEVSGHFKNVQTPIFKEIEEKSGGRISFQFYAGGALGGGAELYDIVRTGKADMCLASCGFTPGRFSLTDVLSIPGAFESSHNSQLMSIAVLDRILEPEFVGTQILSTQQSDPFYLYTKKKIGSINDMKGLKIRSAGGMCTPAITAWGATPVAMPVPDLYLSAQTGIVEGAVTGVSGVAAFKLYEVLLNELSLASGCFGFIVDIWVMNPRTWAGLPPDLQKIVKDAVRKGGLYHVDLAKQEHPVIIEKLKSRGGGASTVSDSDNKLWIDAMRPVVEKWVADEEAKGKPAKKAVAIVREECKKFNVPFPY